MKAYKIATLLMSYLVLGKGRGFDPVDRPDEGMTRDIADAVKSIE